MFGRLYDAVAGGSHEVRKARALCEVGNRQRKDAAADAARYISDAKQHDKESKKVARDGFERLTLLHAWCLWSIVPMFRKQALLGYKREKLRFALNARAASILRKHEG